MFEWNERVDNGEVEENEECDFLNEFVEVDVCRRMSNECEEMRIVYGGRYADYVMEVCLKNGLREGKATIRTPQGVVFVELSYERGKLNGDVKMMNEDGQTVLKGQLRDDKPFGVFEEYDEEWNVKWRGYYRGNRRFSEVKALDGLNGMYEERRVDDNRLLSISKYDDSCLLKNGECFEFGANGCIEGEYVYENGMKKRVIRRFVNGKMLMFDGYGNEVYEGGYCGNPIDGYKQHGKGFEFHTECEGSIFYGHFQSGQRHGMGILIPMRGFVFISEWRSGNLHGKAQWMVNGIVIGESVWENGNPIPSSEGNEIDECPDVFARCLNEVMRSANTDILIFSNNRYNKSDFNDLDLSDLFFLKRLIVGRNCFHYVTEFKINGLNKLQFIQIGVGSFCFRNNESSSELRDGFQVTNCPKLTWLEIGDNSFIDYEVMELNNLPSLQFIRIGEFGFHKLRNVYFVGMDC